MSDVGRRSAHDDDIGASGRKGLNSLETLLMKRFKLVLRMVGDLQRQERQQNPIWHDAVEIAREQLRDISHR